MIQPTGLALVVEVEVDQVQHPEPETQQQGPGEHLEVQWGHLEVQWEHLKVQWEHLEVQWEHLEVQEMKIVIVMRECQRENLVFARTTMIRPIGLVLALAVEVDQVQHPEPEEQHGLKRVVLVKRRTLQEGLGVLVDLTEVVQGEHLEVQWEHLEVQEMKIVIVMSMILVEVAQLLAAVHHEKPAGVQVVQGVQGVQGVLEDLKQLTSPLKIQMHCVLLEAHSMLSVVHVSSNYFEIKRSIMICV